jgi:hypothetical protein
MFMTSVMFRKFWIILIIECFQDHSYHAQLLIMPRQHIFRGCMMHYLCWHWLKLCVGQYYWLMNMIRNGSYMTHYLRCQWFEKYVEQYCYQKGITLIKLWTLCGSENTIILLNMWLYIFMRVDRASIILQCLKNKYT